MKKNIFSKVIVALALVAGPWALSSCSNEDNYWTEPVSIIGHGVVHHEATIEVGSTLQLRAETGILIGGTGFEWTSTNPEVATIDENGLVKALSAGETTIIATTTGSDITNQGQIVVYVVNMGVGLIDDQIDQSEAE